jgi:hypothetical protein
MKRGEEEGGGEDVGLFLSFFFPSFEKRKANKSKAKKKLISS